VPLGSWFDVCVSELLNLKIEDTDLDHSQIHLERLKSSKVHDPAVSKALVRTLNAYIRISRSTAANRTAAERASLKTLRQGVFR
jgi:integrase